MSDGRTPERLAVAKTYKLYLGGAFQRSESGRVYPVHEATGGFLANAARASRKDVRDAVSAARKAFAGWSGATPYNRGQVIYRIAEVLEGRRAQFTAGLRAAEGLSAGEAEAVLDTAIDRLVWYAGWTDKVAAVLGSPNPVAGPYFSCSSPEPVGVVGVLAPQNSCLLGLISALAPVIATGNTCVLVASERRPLPAIDFAEVLATSDVPGGVVNVLTGRTAELGPVLAAHADVNALDLTGAADAELRAELEEAAAGTAKRVLATAEPDDWTTDPGLRRLRSFVELKTLWHPLGA
ncbi:aldehyde dehydrogenase family protein [Saccharopolyspora rectivirgula]|jgi:acyl-CoA reductase-like NAD-dependent aldehyde dehydrogenase|uniref:Aldehyde dehydrogenase n=1 Tax=Saccharopolyspora rectivirgula TaxID=28042 RepID=A0A073BEJ4_9PSEU|nr:aldehyde dehydrogenase family protein [Saccharopolyspora rectivirgula]KEI46144.1 aldehyde dehydrogenase [Saccharopolyspora rectivirgula]